MVWTCNVHSPQLDTVPQLTGHGSRYVSPSVSLWGKNQSNPQFTRKMCILVTGEVRQCWTLGDRVLTGCQSGRASISTCSLHSWCWREPDPVQRLELQATECPWPVIPDVNRPKIARVHKVSEMGVNIVFKTFVSWDKPKRVLNENLDTLSKTAVFSKLKGHSGLTEPIHNGLS